MRAAALIGVAALFLATGTAHAYDAAKDYRPNYDSRTWEPADPPSQTETMCATDEECAAECMKAAKTKREIAKCWSIVEEPEKVKPAKKAKRSLTPAICFTEMTDQNADKLFRICGDLSDCSDGGWCEELERDKQAHIKAGRLDCDIKKEKCKLHDHGKDYAQKDYIWDCASYRWKWEDREWGRKHGYKTLADACVMRPCRWMDNWSMCADGNMGYVPRKLLRKQLRDLGRVPRERYVKEK